MRGMRDEVSVSALRHLDAETLRAGDWTTKTITSRKEPVAVLVRHSVYLEIQRLFIETKALLASANFADGVGTILTQDAEALEEAIAKAEGRGQAQ